jgi:hypothetical protein
MKGIYQKIPKSKKMCGCLIRLYNALSDDEQNTFRYCLYHNINEFNYLLNFLMQRNYVNINMMHILHTIGWIENYDILFNIVCQYNNTELINWILSLTTYFNFNDFESNEINHIEYTFSSACEHGHIDVAKILLKLSSKIKDPSKKILSDGFINVCAYDKFDMAIWLYNEYNDIYKFNMFEAFDKSCRNGCLNTAKWLYPFAKNDLKDAYCQGILDFTCKHGNVETISWMSTLDEFKHLEYDGYQLFHACHAKNVNICSWLIEKNNKKFVDGIAKYAFETSFFACSFDCIKLTYPLTNITIDAEYAFVLCSKIYNNYDDIECENIVKWLLSLVEIKKEDIMKMEVHSMYCSNDGMYRTIKELFDIINSGAKHSIFKINKIVCQIFMQIVPDLKVLLDNGILSRERNYNSSGVPKIDENDVLN